MVRLSILETPLNDSQGAQETALRGIAMLKELALRSAAKALDLELASRALVTVQPARLRDPGLATSYAGRGLALDHRQSPKMFHTLSTAYRLMGQPEKSRAAAREGLAVLSAGNSKPSRIRRLLEADAIAFYAAEPALHNAAANTP